MGYGPRRADNDALARDQPIRLYHDGRMENVNAFSSSSAVAQTAYGRSGCYGAAETASQILCWFQAGRRLGWPKTRRPRSWSASTMPSESGSSGPTMVIRLLSLSKADHRVQALQVYRNTAGNLGDAAVAGSANNLRHPFVARHRPGQRMFAAPGTKDQDLHVLHTFRTNQLSPKGYGPQSGWGKSNQA